jgi:DNA-binding NarL/FixJ family response regulator
MAPLLREIVRAAVSREPDLEIVAEHDVVDLSEAVEQDDPDFVIVGSDGADQSIRPLVASGRGPRTLYLRSDGKESVLYELRPHRVSLGEISSDTLLRAIRAAPRWDGKA